MPVETVSIRRPVPTGRLPGLASAGIIARGLMQGALISGAVFGLMVWALASQFSKEYPTRPPGRH